MVYAIGLVAKVGPGAVVILCDGERTDTTMTARSTPGPILMIAGVPVNGSYIGGIGISTNRLLQRWNLPYSVVHLNTQLWRRAYGATGRLHLDNLFMNLITFARLSWAALRVRPAFVHYHTSIGLAFLKDMTFAAWLRHVFRVRVILHIRSSVADSILITKRRRIQRLQIKMLLSCCDRLVFLSNNVLSEFVRLVGPGAADKLKSVSRVIPNFTLIRDKYRIHQDPADHVRLFYIGNIGPRKGMCDLIEAANRLRGRLSQPFEVVLAGPFDDDKEESRIRDLIAEHGLDRVVTFLGPIYGDCKEAAFLQADIFVLPSYSEGIPQAMLEAMAYGLPVVVSDVGGIPEVVQDGREGLVVKPGDIDGLCHALLQLIGSVESRRRIGAAARRRIAEYHTPDTHMQQLRDLYGSLHVVPGQV